MNGDESMKGGVGHSSQAHKEYAKFEILIWAGYFKLWSAEHTDTLHMYVHSSPLK